jgi:hypothetical protein
VILVVAWSSHSVAQGHPELLSRMTGTWDVQQRMWPGPKEDRHALLNYNPVTSRYEYTSLDTRGPQLMVERSLPIAPGASASDLKLQGGSFLAPEWGSAKNVRFKYRLTIGAIKENQQTARLFLMPETVLPKTEFLAFEYVYTKRP